MYSILIISVISTFISPLESARILAAFPLPSISHQVVFRALTKELIKQGHEVTVITPDPAFPKDGAPRNLTEIDVHDISYKIWWDNLKKTSEVDKADAATQYKIMIDALTVLFDAQLQNEEVKKVISATNKYDLLLLEACVRPALVLTHVFKAPVILVSSFGADVTNYKLVGAPEHPLLYPNLLRQKIHNLTMMDKVRELYNHYNLIKATDMCAVGVNAMLKKNFGPETPTVEELGNNVDLILFNSNPVFEGIRSVPPNVIYMGGLHQNPAKPLPEDLKKYLDSSKNGVVYVSFGTNVDSTLIPTERVQTLIRVFSKLPYDVLFKWDDENLHGRTDNIKISKWLPQSDLLRHPKVKLFITQGGLQSTDEAITAGVPLIGIPMLADQWYNAEKYVYHGIGAQLDLGTLTEELLMDTINQVIGDESYRRNIIKLRDLMTDQPMKPMERAIWWIEYVLRHGGAKHLRSPAANISWTEYLELELVFTVLGASLIILALLIGSLVALYKYFNSLIRTKSKLN
ncbi:UDP-glycosyltransferase UGT5-like [Anticarsia gemmatalis]|uniref:UDP-glycosyltransferase UGT5-like n=1 Tax=Anticarsia gemmatalis TaxID=129554 RepID=UPI003F76537E